MCFEIDAEPTVQVCGDRVRIGLFSRDGAEAPSRVFAGALTPEIAVRLLSLLKTAVDEITSPIPAGNVLPMRSRSVL